MAERAAADHPAHTTTSARKGPSFDPPGATSQLRSRSSDWRVGVGGAPLPSSSIPPASSPVLGGGPAHRPSSSGAGAGAGPATASHLHNYERPPEAHETNAPGFATEHQPRPPYPTRTDIIDDRPEIHAPQPSRLKPWKDILATRSDMLGLDKPPPRLPQCPPVPRKDSPHQGA